MRDARFTPDASLWKDSRTEKAFGRHWEEEMRWNDFMARPESAQECQEAPMQVPCGAAGAAGAIPAVQQGLGPSRRPTLVLHAL